MELPKNVTLIGEPDRSCKIYVEDYVISYIKQLNRHAGDKQMAVALYGNRQEEAGITYLFFYGSCRLNFLQRESRHLSQAVQQEAEEMRRKYFSQYSFLGYRLLNGEMVEGFHVCEQGVCRYIEGYAQFYEKNDSMLAFMLEDRKEVSQPEEVNQEKYDEVKKRQEERRLKAEEQSGQAKLLQFVPRRAGAKKTAQDKSVEKKKVRNLRNMQYTAAAVFVLLLVAGFATLNGDGTLDNLQTTFRQMMEQMNTQQIPDVVDMANNAVNAGSIVTEDRLTEALREENAEAVRDVISGDVSLPDVVPSGTPPESSDVEPMPESTPEPTSEPITSEPTPEYTSEPMPESSPEPATSVPETTVEPTPEPTVEPFYYIVKRGQTLSEICREYYHSEDMLEEICKINNITNADYIMEGQKILLP